MRGDRAEVWDSFPQWSTYSTLYFRTTVSTFVQLQCTKVTRYYVVHRATRTVSLDTQLLTLLACCIYIFIISIISSYYYAQYESIYESISVRTRILSSYGSKVRGILLKVFYGSTKVSTFESRTEVRKYGDRQLYVCSPTLQLYFRKYCTVKVETFVHTVRVQYNYCIFSKI